MDDTSSPSPTTPPPPSSQSALAPAWLERALLAALIGVFVWQGLMPAWRTLNTDFPNNYLCAKLFRDGVPVDRIIDWVWFQRQKDHAGLDYSLVGYGPATIFSSLIILPFVVLPALAAKRAWLLVNLLLLALTGRLLVRMTGLGARRVALVTFAAVLPLQRNFQYGQQHVVVLFLLTLALWLLLRGRGTRAGLALAAAAALKLYPALFALALARKRRWMALGGLAVGLVVSIAIAVILFGGESLRVYALRMLPRAAVGEGIDPFLLGSNSLTTLLRRLFVLEPAVNPRPFVDAPMVFAVLQPLLHAAILLPTFWLLRPGRQDVAADKLDWALVVAALLLSSSLPGTYHFCALILPASLAIDELLRRGQPGRARAVLAVYTLVCLPLDRVLRLLVASTSSADAGSSSVARLLLAFPRLYVLLVLWLLVLGVVLLQSGRAAVPSRRAAVVLAAIAIVVVGQGARANARHLRRALPADATRLSVASGAWMSTDPAPAGDAVYFTSQVGEGYVVDREGTGAVVRAAAGVDVFHPTLTDGRAPLALAGAWLEVAGRRSYVARFRPGAAAVPVGELPVEIDDAQQPTVSPDGRWLAFLREDRGRGRLWLVDRRVAWLAPILRAQQRQVVGAGHDVLELTFFADGRVLFADAEGGKARLRLLEPLSGRIGEFPVPGRERTARALDRDGGGAARYPAVSPDDRWIAYSHEERGNWQLWVMNVATGEGRRLTDGDCNSTSPAWRADSRTVVYASDCGRAIGSSMLVQLRALP